MAGKDVAPSADSKSAWSWTEDDKVHLLFNMVAAFRQDGQSIPWNRVTLPGRTTKSCMHMWAKINTKMTSYAKDVEERAGVPITPPKTPRGRGLPTKRRPQVLEDVSAESAAKMAKREIADAEDDEANFKELFRTGEC